MRSPSQMWFGTLEVTKSSKVLNIMHIKTWKYKIKNFWKKICCLLVLKSIFAKTYMPYIKYIHSNICYSHRKILNKFSILSYVLNSKLKNAYLLEKVWQPPWRTLVRQPRGPPQNPPALQWSPPPGNAAGRSPWPFLEPTCCQAPWNKQQFKLL